jgi:hypothetical protein
MRWRVKMKKKLQREVLSEQVKQRERQPTREVGRHSDSVSASSADFSVLSGGALTGLNAVDADVVV